MLCNCVKLKPILFKLPTSISSNLPVLVIKYKQKNWRCFYAVSPIQTNTNMTGNQSTYVWLTVFKSFLLSKVCVDTTVVSHKYRLERSTNASVRTTYNALSTYPGDLLLSLKHGLSSFIIVHGIHCVSIVPTKQLITQKIATEKNRPTSGRRKKQLVHITREFFQGLIKRRRK